MKFRAPEASCFARPEAQAAARACCRTRSQLSGAAGTARCRIWGCSEPCPLKTDSTAKRTCSSPRLRRDLLGASRRGELEASIGGGAARPASANFAAIQPRLPRLLQKAQSGPASVQVGDLALGVRAGSVSQAASSAVRRFGEEPRWHSRLRRHSILREWSVPVVEARAVVSAAVCPRNQLEMSSPSDRSEVRLRPSSPVTAPSGPTSAS